MKDELNIKKYQEQAILSELIKNKFKKEIGCLVVQTTEKKQHIQELKSN